MTAPLLNKILIGSLVALIIASGIGFYFASKFLSQTALDTAHVRADTAILTENLEKLKRLETEMQDKSDIVARAHQIVSDSSSFQHQNQIVQDVNTYAGIAGVTVAGFSFAPEDNPTSANPAQAKIPGVKTLNATVTLNTPIKYDSFLKFLKSIEQNLTKMQVTGVNMTPALDDATLVNNPTIGLLIYVKE